MAKITAEQVVDAYETMNLKAKRFTFRSLDNCACGLGALWAKENANSANHSTYIYKMFDDRFGKAYVDGFTNGFDGYDPSFVSNSEDYIEGYNDGKAAYEAVLAKGLFSIDTISE